MNKINFITIHKIVYWIVIIWFQRVPHSIDHSRTWVNQVESWHRLNGPIWTIKYIKMMKQLIISYLSDKPQKEVDMIIGINRSNGLPKQLTYLHTLIESRDPLALRFVFSLLSISRAIPGWVDPDLTTLEKPCGANQSMIDELAGFIPQFLQANKFKSKLKYSWDLEDIHFSNKAGPIGRATRDALMDLKFMPESLKEDLRATNIKDTYDHYDKLFKKALVEKWFIVSKMWSTISLPFDYSKGAIGKIIKNTTIGNRVEMIMAGINGFIRPNSYHVRKLSIVKDPEAKSRIIAILDYWSQTWLLQIHRIHFNFLASLDNDRTFTQSPLITNKLDGHKYYSFDLTAATDRFPITLQKELIVNMLGQETANRWESILISTPFYVPWLDKTIKYNCGQPMGAYSSWSTFTITHHMILHYIHHKLNLKELYYIILGDDIVVYHDEVAKLYLHIMKELDVGISIPKTCISTNMYEFAKRIFISNKEVTGIQMRGILENVNKYHLIYQSIYELIHNRFYIPDGFRSIPDLICDLALITGKEYKFALNIRSRVKLLHAFNKYILGDKTLLEEYLVEHFHNYEGQLHFHDVVNLNNYVYQSVMGSIESKQAEFINYAQDLIRDPHIVNPATWGLVDPSDIWTSQVYLITQTPLMRSLANVIESLSKARKLDSLKAMIEVLALPSPSIFTSRASTRIIGAKAKLAKRFLAEFESLVIQGSTSQGYQPNLGINVLRGISSSIETLIRSTPRHFGLLPPAPTVKPKISDMWSYSIIGQ